MKIVIVKRENCGNKFVFSAPDNAELQAGDLVRVRNKKGEKLATCMCDAFSAEPGSAPFNAVLSAFGAVTPLAPVIGKYEYRNYDSESVDPDERDPDTQLYGAYEKIFKEHVVGSSFGDLGYMMVGDKIIVPLKSGKKLHLVVTDVSADWLRLESEYCVLGFGSLTMVHERMDSLYNDLPDEFVKFILPTERVYRSHDGEIIQQTRKLFLPSAAEVFADDDCYGDEGLYKQLDYYKDRRHRMRYLDETAYDTCYWWLLSPHAGHATYWCCASYYGNASTADASITSVAAPVCFRIRRI